MKKILLWIGATFFPLLIISFMVAADPIAALIISVLIVLSLLTAFSIVALIDYYDSY